MTYDEKIKILRVLSLMEGCILAVRDKIPTSILVEMGNLIETLLIIGNEKND